MNRIQLLEDALQNIQTYTRHADGWRPGLVDVFVYNYIMDMHEGDENEESPEFVWNDTPDHIMQKIMDSGYIFDLEYGTQELWEILREHLIQNDFITSVDELEKKESNDN